MALGDRDRAVTLFKGSIAAILVATFGQTILLSVIGVLGGWSEWSAQAEQVTRYPGAGTLVYVLAFTLLLLAAVNLARGRVEEGGWMIVGSVLALALVVFAAQAFNTTVMAYGGGPLLVEARTDKAFYKPGEQVFLYVTVRASGLAVSTVDLHVDWGDGTTTEKTEVPVGREVLVCYREGVDLYGIPYCEGKTYGLRSGEEASFYTIGVKATAQAGESQLTGSTYVTVYVRELPGLAFPFSVLGGFISWLLNLLTGGTLDPTRLFYAPVFRLDGPEGEWYRTVLTASVALLPVFILFRIAPGLAYDPGRAVVDGFRDAAFAVIAMILIPHAYNVTAGALNTFTEMLMGPAGATIVSQMAGTATAWAIVFMVVSLVSPGVGFLGTLILITVLMVSALAALRWFVILSVVSASPFLVLAWLHPYLRGGVDTLKGLVGAMLVAGPVAAMFTLLFSKVILGDNPVQQILSSFMLSWLGVFIVGLLPQLVSGLAATGLGSAISHRLESAVMKGAPQVSKAALVGSARGLATGATAAGRAAYAQAIRVKPLADAMRAGGVMVGRARETLSRAVTGLQKGLENRVARDKTRFSGAISRLSALTNLKKGYQELHELDQRAGDAYNRLYDALQYYNELSPEEQQDPEKMLPLALARMEYDTLVEARAEKEEQLEEQLREYYEKNMIKSDERRMLKTTLRTPQIAIGSLNKMIEEQEHEVQMREVELKRDRATHGRFANAIGGLGGAPARLKKIISDALTIPRKLEEKREGARGAGVVVVIKVKERA
jgi:carbon starvation protein